jgi:hypothetical protein
LSRSATKKKCPIYQQHVLALHLFVKRNTFIYYNINQYLELFLVYGIWRVYVLARRQVIMELNLPFFLSIHANYGNLP